MQPRLLTVTLAAVASALLCGVLVHAEPQYYSSRGYNYWSDPSVDLPNLFGVDQRSRRVLVAATNYIFHLSLDLRNISNAWDVTPSEATFVHCKFDIFNPDEVCQNFHHILYFQSGPGYINTTYGLVPKEDTVLVCGSNAYSPECVYRNRTNLENLTRFEASGFCPFGEEYGVTLVAESGQMVAGIALDPDPAHYAITLSTAPFSGDILLTTVKDDFLYFNDPAFVSLYENGDFYYLFMTESPVESSQHDTFSRVARVCKNDTGRMNLAQTVFVTYVKARMVCRSTLFSTIAYDYNVLQDMVLVNSSSANAPLSGEHLYGIFTGEINGPVGSALCFYTFDGLGQTLSGNFLVQSSTSEWTEVKNEPPLNCAEGRTLDSAEERVLMSNVALQENGEPMLTMDATVFHKLLVDRVTALDQKEYEVLLIAASVHDKLQLLKLTHIPSREGSDKSFLIQASPLNRNGSGGSSQDVGKIELYKTDHEASVYVSTSEGLYVVPISDCSTHSDCWSCVEARDPYCAYDISEKSCVTTLGNTDDRMKLQDVVNGDSSGCDAPFSATTSTISSLSSQSSPPFPVPQPSPSSAISSMDVGLSSRAQLGEMSSPLPVRPVPTVEDVEPQTASIMDHIWTIVAGVGGLIVGMVVGLLLFAAIRNREKFLWWHYLLNRHCDSNSDEKCDEYCIDFDKIPEQNINNSKPLPPRPTTPPLTKLNPTASHAMKITDSPVLTKYSSTSRHRRSNSSGGSLGIQLTDQVGSHLNNVKHTMHVEESVSNSDRERYGKNMLSRQISKDYPPMPSKEGSISYQVQSGSLVFPDP